MSKHFEIRKPSWRADQPRLQTSKPSPGNARNRPTRRGQQRQRAALPRSGSLGGYFIFDDHLVPFGSLLVSLSLLRVSPISCGESFGFPSFWKGCHEVNPRQNEKRVQSSEPTLAPRSGQWRRITMVASALLLAGATAVMTVHHSPASQEVRAAGSGMAAEPSLDLGSTTTTTAPALAATEGASSSTTSTVPSSTTTTRPTTSTTQRPTTTQLSPPSLAPVTVPPPVDDDMLSLPAGGIAFPFEAGKSSWEATSNGLSIQVRIEPAAPVVGEVVHFIATASKSGAPCCSVIVGYDGHMADQLASADPACPHGATPMPTEASVVYSAPGQFRFKVVADDCSAASLSRGWVTGWLPITDPSK